MNRKSNVSFWAEVRIANPHQQGESLIITRKFRAIKLPTVQIQNAAGKKRLNKVF